jgi:hypothetical protein
MARKTMTAIFAMPDDKNDILGFRFFKIKILCAISLESAWN